MTKETLMQQLIKASTDLVNWLNGNGLTNKSRRNRVPASKLETLENALSQLAEAGEEKKPTNKEISDEFPCNDGKKKVSTHEANRNYFRRQGAKWARDFKSR